MADSIIAIGGPHGSGKSSIAKKLANELGMNYVSAGNVFREMAKERGLSVKEFSKIVMDKPEIDRAIDERTKEIGSKENTIVDAQLAAHFTPKDAALKICITASSEIRYQRIAQREDTSFEKAREETKIREKSEEKRFFDLYGIDINDKSPYDIVVNNDRMSFQKTYDLCKALAVTALS